MLFYNAHAYAYAALSASLLVGQFTVVWLRVLPYLHATYGPDSTFYRLFLYFGMPFGCFFLDFLMFLEPFGLLPITPMPETLRQFVPAYKSTRIIAEVLIEALPQCVILLHRGTPLTYHMPPIRCTYHMPPIRCPSTRRHSSPARAWRTSDCVAGARCRRSFW